MVNLESKKHFFVMCLNVVFTETVVDGRLVHNNSWLTLEAPVSSSANHNKTWCHTVKKLMKLTVFFVCIFLLWVSSLLNTFVTRGNRKSQEVCGGIIVKA